MSKNILSKKYFLKTVMFRFFQKPSLEYILTKGVQTIYKLNQSKTRKEQLKTEYMQLMYSKFDLRKSLYTR